ncbi:MAG: hypothetical protein JXM70_06135 [Pirellulales bacterium]|nr:hypothetical protein [Pirellulales bacterium]
MLRYLTIAGLLVFCGGCSLLPDVAHKPSLHNPFPQLSRVAIAPFFNASNEPTVDGREFAIAYYNELQNVPGFEVVPVGVVETELRNQKLTLASAADAQRLARALNVDAVVIGVVTDYSPYYPPRLGMQVKWYAANPGFHSIPPGYGLPWGTPDEENIPAPLLYEAEMALAKQQLKTQTPDCSDQEQLQDEKTQKARQSQIAKANDAEGGDTPVNERTEPAMVVGPDGREIAANQQTSRDPLSANKTNKSAGKSGATPFDSGPLTWEESARLAAATPPVPGIPAGWPDPRGFIPPPPSSTAPTCWPTDKPVMELTRNYDGSDINLTEALSSYHYFRDDARFGGWQAYLQRSEDFIGFCAHMHIWEMLSARGGAGKTRVVWRWPTIR